MSAYSALIFTNFQKNNIDKCYEDTENTSSTNTTMVTRGSITKREQSSREASFIKLQERLLTEPHYYKECTTFIDIERFEEVKSFCRQFFIDIKAFNVLTETQVINWFTEMARLYPLRVIGDGNCLCHACLVYLTGYHDNFLHLRQSLKNYITTNSKQLKERFFNQQKEFNKTQMITSEDKLLEKEWLEIEGMKTDAQKKSLTFLEDVHVFALANRLQRPIIVVSQEYLNDLQPNFMRGIYLPLLHSPSSCYKKPIIIAFWNFHFMPLVFADNQVLKKGQSYNGINFDNFLSDVYNESKVKTFSLLPLETCNKELYPVKFLLPKEEKDDLLKKYLIIKRYGTKNEKNDSRLICCDISETEKMKNDYLSIYFDNLKETFTVKTQFYDFNSVNKCCMKGCNADVISEKNTYCKSCADLKDSFSSQL